MTIKSFQDAKLNSIQKLQINSDSNHLNFTLNSNLNLNSNSNSNDSLSSSLSTQNLNNIKGSSHYRHRILSLPPKPPPISISPNLRKLNALPHQSLSSLLDPDSLSNPAGQQLELADSLDWDLRTGRSDGLAMRLNPNLPSSRDGGRDRWGNRWGIENHILSPVISEQTEPTHTELSSSISTSSPSLASLMDSIPTQGTSNPPLTQPASSQSKSPPPLSKQQEKSLSNQQQPRHTHHQHAMNLLNRKKIKTQISNRQRDLDVAHRQMTKRLEKQKREQLISRRDEIAAQLMRNPSDAKLVRDLGKLYLEFHHPVLEDKPMNSFRWTQTNQVIHRSESSLKLAIHYLEQSIQIDNLDSLTWFYLAKAWSLLLAYPTDHPHEREQRLSNSSLAFKKAIVISSNLTDPSHHNIQQINRFRSAYAQHLEGIQNYKEAASILQDALELDESDADCWWALGRMMERWALDTQSELVITKQEKFEMMKHSSQAYQKAAELQPEDSIIQQSKLNAEKALEKFRLELKKQEPENYSRKSQAEQDVTLTAERIRGLNLSPVQNRNPSAIPIESKQNNAKSSSALALKKLVAELRDIPEFGKKPTLSTSQFPLSSEVNDEKKITQQPNMSIDRTSAQAESAASNSPTPFPHALHQIQQPTSEIDESSFNDPSLSSPVTHENQMIAPGLQSFQLSPLISDSHSSKKLPRYFNHTSPTSATPSTQDSSPTSTQPHDDVKVTIVSLSIASMPPQNQQTQDSQESPGLQTNNNASHTFHSNSCEPPSPRDLPTSMMQSLSSRSSTLKGPIISSPRNMLTSVQTSDNTAQKEDGTVNHKLSPQLNPHESRSVSRPSLNSQSPILNQSVEPTSQSARIVNSFSQTLHDPPHIFESNAKHLQPKYDVENTTHQTKGELSHFCSPHSSQSKSQHVDSRAEMYYDRPKQVLVNSSPNQDHSMYLQDKNVDSSISHSSCYLHPCHQLNHDPQDQMTFTSDRGRPYLPPIRVVEDSLKVTGQNESEPKRSPPPPQIPPRPKSLSLHGTVPLNFNPIPPSPSPVLNGNLQSKSSLGIRLGSSPHLDNRVGSINSFRDMQKGYPSPMIKQNILATNQVEQTNSSFPARPPLSDKKKIRTTSLTSQISKPINERFSTTSNLNQLHHLSPSSSHQSLDDHLQHSYPVYDYSMIDSHLQSILDVDTQRKAELKQIKKQIKKTDEWAENQRRSIVEEIRRICTPVNNSSSNGKKITQDDRNDDEDGGNSLGKSSHRPKYEDIRPLMKKTSIEADPIHLKNQFESPHHDQSRKNRENYHQSFMSGKFNKSEMSTTINSHTRRSMSTPPELNHHQSSHVRNLLQQQQPQHGPIEFEKETPNSNLEYLKPPFGYQPLIRPSTELKPDRNYPGTILYNQADEFDKLGPAGFAINGITSIIQLLHQPRRRQFS